MNNQTMWKLTPNGLDLFILTLTGPEGVDKIYVDQDELIALKQLLETLNLPLDPNELPL